MNKLMAIELLGLAEITILAITEFFVQKRLARLKRMQKSSELSLTELNERISKLEIHWSRVFEDEDETKYPLSPYL